MNRGVPLQASAGINEVENIVLYIADSVRADAVLDDVTELGVSGKMIAPSTFTASSLPSILSGQYPVSHQVWGFSHRLPNQPELLAEADCSGFNAETIWRHVEECAEKPPLKMLRVQQERELDDLDPPFTYVIHDKGGHSPYGPADSDLDWGSAREFFERYKNDRPSLRELYHQGVQASIERFLNIYESVADSGLLDETLFVYTSDHGELLGEIEHGGVFGHSHPMTPELVEVPIVFAGAGIESGDTHKTLSSVDIAPTLLAARGDTVPPQSDGINLWNGSVGDDRTVKSNVWITSDFPISEYKVTSRWTNTGGIIYNKSNLLKRVIYGLGTNLYRQANAPATRSLSLVENKALLDRYLRQTYRFGSSPPDIDSKDLENDRFDWNEETDETQIEPDTEQLEKLGYIQ